ncbi:hypothetical protein V5075_01750 [Enterobacter asburiae]
MNASNKKGRFSDLVICAFMAFLRTGYSMLKALFVFDLNIGMWPGMMDWCKLFGNRQNQSLEIDGSSTRLCTHRTDRA